MASPSDIGARIRARIPHRSPPRTARIVAVLALLTLAAGAPVEAGKKNKDRGDGRDGRDGRRAAALGEWIEGPVRYIAHPRELSGFRALDRDSDRSLFVEKFWTRRDPTPQTLANEYRALFWQRVREANDNFTETTKPGWKTDRGKIHILYGPPSEVQHRDSMRTDSGVNTGVGLIRWIYQGRPGSRNDLAPVTIVPFVRDLSGEYRLSYDPNLSSLFLNEFGNRDGFVSEFNRTLEGRAPFGRTELATMLDLGRLQEVPPIERVVIERIETAESYHATELDVQLDRFRHPFREGTVVSVTARMPGSDPALPMTLLARFTPRDATLREQLVGEGAFRYLPDPEGGVMAQGRAVLPPGTWDVLVAAVDARTAATALHRSVLLTGDPPAGLALSDVVSASELEPLQYEAQRSHDEPFLIGAFRVVPRAGLPVAPGDEIHLFYEIYGGIRPYAVTYAVQGLDVDGTWVDLGSPAILEDAEGAQGWTLPTSPNWPLGEYRVRIRVADRNSRTVETFAPFTLVPRSQDSPGEGSPPRVVPVTGGSPS